MFYTSSVGYITANKRFCTLQTYVNRGTHTKRVIGLPSTQQYVLRKNCRIEYLLKKIRVVILRVWSLDHEVPLFYFPLSLLPPSLLFSFLSHLSTLALGFAYIVCVLSRSVMSSSLQLHGLQPARLLCPWEFSRLEYWSGLPCPPPWNLPNPGMEPRSPAWQAVSLPSEPPRKPIH